MEITTLSISHYIKLKKFYKKITKANLEMLEFGSKG